MGRRDRPCEYCFDSIGSKSQIRLGSAAAYVLGSKPTYAGRNDLTPEDRVMTPETSAPSGAYSKEVTDLLSLELL